MKMYPVGGYVRDKLLGIQSKDIDFTVVLEDLDLDSAAHQGLTAFEQMADLLAIQGFKIFKIDKPFFTVRAKVPGEGYYVEGDEFYRPFDRYRGMTFDFVLARKESGYTDGRRPDVVEVGTLEDDLRRRDFTINAMALDGDTIIDPFGGQADMVPRIIRTVGEPKQKILDDALRAVRAMRFAVTLPRNFMIESSLRHAMESKEVCEAVVENIADDRIREELNKMLYKDTVKTLEMMRLFPRLTRAMFAGKVSLDATLKQKGRG